MRKESKSPLDIHGHILVMHGRQTIISTKIWKMYARENDVNMTENSRVVAFVIWMKKTGLLVQPLGCNLQEAMRSVCSTAQRRKNVRNVGEYNMRKPKHNTKWVLMICQRWSFTAGTYLVNNSNSSRDARICRNQPILMHNNETARHARNFTA